MDKAKNCYMTQCRSLKQSKWKENDNIFSELCNGLIKLIEVSIEDIEHSHLYILEFNYIFLFIEMS